VWIYTDNKSAKFHWNILSLSENIAKSFRGATFFWLTLYTYTLSTPAWDETKCTLRQNSTVLNARWAGEAFCWTVNVSPVMERMTGSGRMYDIAVKRTVHTVPRASGWVARSKRQHDRLRKRWASTQKSLGAISLFVVQSRIVLLQDTGNLDFLKLHLHLRKCATSFVEISSTCVD